MDKPSEKIKEKILSLFLVKSRQRLSIKEIQIGIKLLVHNTVGLLASLQELIRDGKIVRLGKNHYSLPAAQNLLTGRIHRHPDGFGFLIPDDRGKEDLYLNRREMRRLMHGDRALVRIDKIRRGRIQAHIVQVLEHKHNCIIGTYEKLEGKEFLFPMDPRISPPLKLVQGKLEVKQGSIIAGKILKYGTPHSAPEVTISEVLGDPDDPEVQAQAVIVRFGLSTTFSMEAKLCASSCGHVVSPEETRSRVDLKALPTVTIDGETARDFDDAVSIEKKKGLYYLTISISDVAHYIKPDTALDLEAYQRATSVYFPDRAIPMLPEELSNGICSLNPLEERLTKSVLLEIDAKGEVRRETFFRSTICSNARLTYTEVRRILVDGDPNCKKRYRTLIDSLKLMEELARILWEKRKTMGSLDFNLPDAEFILDIKGMPENIIRADRNIGHRIIEEFMIAANEAVARYLTKNEFPILYRVHEGPEEKSIQALIPFLLSLGYRLPLKKGKVSPKDIQTIIETCRGKPEERTLNRNLLRSMKQARYGSKNLGHFGLASSCYTHFTSPIRRYPDLIVHRILDRALNKEKTKTREKDNLLYALYEAGVHTSERERIAMDAERAMLDLKKTQFMSDKIGQEFTGIIIELAPYGFFVELENYFVEGLVHLNTLQDDDYHYYEKKHIIKGRKLNRIFHLGDTVQIRVLRINAFRTEIVFELVKVHSMGSRLGTSQIY